MIGEALKIAGDPINDWVWCILLLLPRLLVIMQFWPVWCDTLPTTLVKSSAAMGMLVLPAQYLLPHAEKISISGNGMVLHALTEAVLGLIIGMTLALPMYALKACGALIDVLRGATFSALINPSSGGEELPLERLAGLGFGLWLLLTPLWLQAVELVLESYRLVPPAAVFTGDSAAIGRVLIALFSDHLVWSIQFLAPVFVFVLLVEVALFLISGFVSNIQTYSVDMALKGVMCLLIVLLLSQYAPDSQTDLLDRMTHQSLGALKRLLGI